MRQKYKKDRKNQKEEKEYFLFQSYLNFSFIIEHRKWNPNRHNFLEIELLSFIGNIPRQARDDKPFPL